MDHTLCKCSNCEKSAGGSLSAASISGTVTPEVVWEAEGGIPWNNTTKYEVIVAIKLPT